MLRLDKITYRIGARVLLDAADATINTGHRVGLVGRNGTGKTTILKLIAGILDLDGGQIHMPVRWKVGLTHQEAPSGSQSLLDTVLSADAELVSLEAEAQTATDPHRIAEIHARLSDMQAHSAHARAARILVGLGFDNDAQQRPCSEFSGGWRMRVALASLLFSEPDLLLLDEPTNHLDLEATLWLEGYLRTYPGTIVLVSHDRELLNRAVSEILHLEHSKLTLYQGGYDRFEKTRRERLELNAKQRARREAQTAHIREFIDRFRYKASKAKQAQSRIKMLAKMQPIPEDRDEASISFNFPEPTFLASPLLTTEHLSAGYGDNLVLSNLDLRLDSDDRIALLGANGNGKSTLVKILAGRLQPLSGDITKSKRLRVGYFAQHQTEELDVEATPYILMERARPRDNEPQVRAQLGRFGFQQERAETKVGNLSGGEKARLNFALITADKPNILLLDEPTNHLDVDSRQALVHALNLFNGTVILVSHDPHLIETTVDTFWLVEGGEVKPFDGDLDDYRSRLLGRRQAQRGEAPRPEKEKPPKAEYVDKKEARRQSAAKRALIGPLKKEATDCEAWVKRLERKKVEITKELADPALYDDGADNGHVIELQVQSAKMERDLEDAEKAWLGALDALEKAQS